MSEHNWQNPERVEPGQVWDHFGEAYLCKSKHIVVREVRGNYQIVFHKRLVVSQANGGDVKINWIATGPTVIERWRCVGYELDDGRRVMVGDRFRSANGVEWVVSAVLSEARVELADAMPEFRPEFRPCIPAHKLLDPAGWVPVLSSAPVLNLNTPWYCALHARGATSGQCPVCSVKTAETDAQARLAAQRGAAGDAARSERWRRITVGVERSRRDALRREIDKLLAEDARRCPAFATARRAAVLADVEMPEDAKLPERGPRAIERLIRTLHSYEAARGGGRSPSAKAVDMMAIDTALVVYERARGQR